MRKIITILFFVGLSAAAFAQPGGYTEGTWANWSYNSRAHGFFKAVGWNKDVDHLVIFWGGDGQNPATFSTFDDIAPATFLASGQWNGVTTLPDGTTKKWLIFMIGNTGVTTTADTDLEYFWTNLAGGFDTSAKSRLHMWGLSGGPGRMWDYIRNSNGYANNRYRMIFGTTISMSVAAIFTNLIPYSSHSKNYCWYGATDPSNGLTPPSFTINLYNNLLGGEPNIDKRLKFTPGQGHSNATWGNYNDSVSCLGLTGHDSSSNRWIWAIQANDPGPPPVVVCDNPALLPIPEYRVYDFSGSSAEYKGVRSNVKGTGSVQYLFRNDYDPKAGVVPPTDTITRYFGMPRSSNSRNSIFRDGYLKIWVDFRRKVKIDSMYILHNTYVSDSMYIIFDHDSTYWNNKGSIREIPEYFRITPRIATVLPTNNGNNLTTRFSIKDSARFMLVLLKNTKTTFSADSAAKPIRFAFYGCSDESIAFNDSTWTGPRKKPWPINENSGSNMTTEELAFAPGQTRSFMETEHVNRRYGQRGPAYGWDNKDTSAFNINNRTNRYNLSLDNYVSEETFFEGIYGYDSVMYARYHPYIFRAEQGPSAYTAKQIQTAGLATGGAQYGWAPIDSLGVNYKLPSSYARAGDAAWQLAAVTGRTAVDTHLLRLNYRPGQRARTAMGIHKGFQNENEMNGYYKPRMMNPIEYDASSQAMYDGWEGRVGPRLGIKAADPTMEFIGQAIAQHDLQEGRAIMYLSRMNRTDQKNIYDVMCYNAYWVEWDDKRQNVTGADYVRTKKAYPESDTALTVLNILADETYIQTGDTTSYTAYTEYGTDHHYRRPVDQTESFSVSIYSTPKYRNAAGTILDSSKSHAIDVMRDQFAGVMSNMTWMTQYVLRDQTDTVSGGRFYAYSYSGKLNPFNDILWSLWYLDAGVKRRFGNYIKDTVLAYQDHGNVIYRLKHKSNPDSLLYIVYYGDTLGTASYDLNVGSGKAVKEWQESYTSATGSEVSGTVSAGHITGTASPEFTFLLVYPSGVPDPEPPRPDNMIQRSGTSRLKILGN